MCLAATGATPETYLNFTITANQRLQVIDNQFGLATKVIIETELAIEL